MGQRLQKASPGARPAIEAEISRRLWSLRYAAKLRRQRIQELEQQLAALRTVQASELIEARSVASWLQRWAPELAATLDASTASWPR